MSFSSDAKRELLKIRPEASCCRRAVAYGFLLFARHFSPENITFPTERETLAHYVAESVAAETGTFVEILTPSGYVRRTGSQYIVTIPRPAQREQILRHFGHTGREVNLRINYANLDNECCLSSFLRSVFLSCGTLGDPNRAYHMEFVIPYLKLSADLEKMISVISEGAVLPKRVMRKGAHVVYIKESEQILDLLTRIGAVQTAMEMMQVKMYKELRNQVNRATNCETANIEKTAAAAAQQRAAILKIRDGIGLDSLPDELRELALIRLENPDMSLRELGQSLSPPISRSGVNHRLRRILVMAEQTGPDPLSRSRLPKTEAGRREQEDTLKR